jgi:hypothetical protein
MKRILPFLILVAAILLLSVPAYSAPWRFIVVGDTRGTTSSDPNGVGSINTTILTEIANKVAVSGASFVLVPGDLVNGSTTNQSLLETQLNLWRSTMAPVYNAGIGVYATPGNHEMTSTASQELAWQDVFSDMPTNGPDGEKKMTYSFKFNNAFIAAVNTNNVPDAGDPTAQHQVNTTWLNNQINSNPSQHVFVFGHEPAFTMNHPDNLSNYPAIRDQFWNILGGTPDKVYFTGHDHFYDHATMPDANGNVVSQFVVGTGGAPLTTWSPPYGETDVTGIYHAKMYGYMIVEIDGPNVTMTMMGRTGTNVYAPIETIAYSVPVPEPVTIVLVLPALFGLAGIAFRRMRAA